MLAEQHLDLRSRIGAALSALDGLAADTGVVLEPANLLHSVVAGLTDPFLVVVAGEVNAGKSTLLNALFGEEFCETGPLPVTDSVRIYRYGKTRRVRNTGPVMQEIDLPLTFLHDFHLVDTPGVNSTAAGHAAITRDCIPRADAVLFCLSAANPWAESAWSFLRDICQSGVKNVVLVLQQADLRTAAEMEAVTSHMRLLSQQRLGCELPVFPVSARLALLARTSGLDKQRLLEESFLPALEKRVSLLVAGAPDRTARLLSALGKGRAILTKVGAALVVSESGNPGLAGAVGALRETLAEANLAVEAGIDALDASAARAWHAAGSDLGQTAAELAPAFPRLARPGTLPDSLLHPTAPGMRDAAGVCESAIQDQISIVTDAVSGVQRALATGRDGKHGAGRGELAAEVDSASREALRAADLPRLVRRRLRRRNLWTVISLLASAAFLLLAAWLAWRSTGALAGFAVGAGVLSATGGGLFGAMERLTTRQHIVAAVGDGAPAVRAAVDCAARKFARLRMAAAERPAATVIEVATAGLAEAARRRESADTLARTFQRLEQELA